MSLLASRFDSSCPQLLHHLIFTTYALVLQLLAGKAAPSFVPSDRRPTQAPSGSLLLSPAVAGSRPATGSSSYSPPTTRARRAPSALESRRPELPWAPAACSDLNDRGGEDVLQVRGIHLAFYRCAVRPA
jgi:hypothetical protein